jgi:HlyB family type I secretion system ABC transporter
MLKKNLSGSWFRAMTARIAALAARAVGPHFGQFVRERLRTRRVPFIRQMTIVDCGAACLAMILGYHGRRTSLAECREALSLGRDGTTARGLANAARALGLRVKSYSLEPEAFADVPLPAIVFWNFKHYLIVERWTARQVTVVDPSAGRQRMTSEEFGAGFTGLVLTLEPGAQFERRTEAREPLWRSYFLRRVLRSRGVLAQVLGASLLLQVFGLGVPIFTKVLVDDILPFGADGLLATLGVGMVLLAAAQMVIGYLRSTLLIFLQARLDSQLMLGFFEHMLELPFRFFQQRPSGDLLMRLGSNSVIREVLTSQTLSVLLDGTLVLAYLFILLVHSPLFGLLVLAVGSLQVALLAFTTRFMRELTQRDLAAQAQSQSYLVETLAGVETLKASGGEEHALDHWTDLFFNQLNVSLRRNHLTTLIETGMMTLRGLSPLILLWVGAKQMLGGEMSLGTMLALNVLANAFLLPLSSLVSNGQRLQLVGSHVDRIADVLEAEAEQDRRAVRPAPRLSGGIVLEGVGFSYSPDAPDVLRDISLSIEPGQKVALVGRSGSGKSTLAKLLLGLYEPTSGRILFDSLDLKSLDYRSLRRQFGVVLQESFLFSGSIRQNIAFNEPGMPLESVAEAARIAAVDAEIMRMPMGYETNLSEGSAGLAGGQRQRLSLARAVAHDPAILLLDEATSHLDVVTERIVDRNLSGLTCTRVIIAHRLSTIRNADLILVLEGGRIVERGTHDELLERGGHYAELVSAQLTSDPTHASRPGITTGTPPFAIQPN